MHEELEGKILSVIVKILNRNRCEEFGDAGGLGDGAARAGPRDGREWLWQYGEEEAAEQRAA